MHKTFRAVVILMLIVSATTEAELNKKSEAMFFVATNGNNSWSGKLPAPNKQKTDGPFATIVRARNAVRRIKAKRPLTKPVTVMIRGGGSRDENQG